MKALTYAAALSTVLVVAPVVSGAIQGAGTWRRLAPAPIAPNEGLTSVWTGTQMLVVGDHATRAADGAVLKRVNVAAAYDPASNKWRRLPSPGPTTGFMGVDSVWTGKEMLVWGQGTRAAFNPSTDKWRKLPNSRLLAIHDGFALVIWTGREMIGWGGGCCGDAFSDGVTYNPTTNRWRALARTPLAGSQHPIGAWTGRELVIVVGGFDPDGKPWPSRLARAAAYNPKTNTWRRIATPPSRNIGGSGVWDGRELLIIGDSAGYAYSPTTNRWRRLPASGGARFGATSVWTGTRVLLWGGSTHGGAFISPTHALAFDPTTNRWSSLPNGPLSGRQGATAVWTGHAMIVWGGSRPARPAGSGTKYLVDGAAFTPTNA